VSQYQKGKTNLDFTEARVSEWQWHQLGHMQVCISLQTDKYTSTPPLNFFLPATQPTVSKHRRQEINKEKVKKKRISGETYDINKQTIYIRTKIKNQIKGTLCPGDHMGHVRQECMT